MIVAAYLYQPVLYFAVYLPFIVPRLPGWTHIPLPIIVAVVGGYLIVLLAAGRWIIDGSALHALGIIVSNSVFTYVMAQLQMPAFLKSWEEPGDPVATFWDVLSTAVSVLVVVAVLEAGRALGRVMRTRRSPA